jgi:hypothetical protein
MTDAEIYFTRGSCGFAQRDSDRADDLVAREGDRPLEMSALFETYGLATDPLQGRAVRKWVRKAKHVGGDARDGEQRLKGGGVVLGDGAEDEAVGVEEGDLGHRRTYRGGVGTVEARGYAAAMEERQMRLQKGTQG